MRMNKIKKRTQRDEKFLHVCMSSCAQAKQ